jgi:hypothetical protein
VSEELEKPQSIRLKASQAKRLEKASAKMALAKQDVIRMALDFGFKHLEQSNYQLTETVQGVFIQLSEELLKRARNVEQITGLSLASQITTALTSLCIEAEKHGKVTFPLESPPKKSKKT